jgi:hypothetical protein
LQRSLQAAAEVEEPPGMSARHAFGDVPRVSGQIHQQSFELYQHIEKSVFGGRRAKPFVHLANDPPRVE